MSFWSVDDKIPVRQTNVSVFAEHGLEYKSSQKINFHIPPTISYFQPKECYLEFDVQLLCRNGIAGQAPTRLSLDAETGAQSLIRDIRIHSGGAGAVLLEEIQNYNTLVALKYDYESNDVLRNKRALTEGCLTYDPDNRATNGATKSDLNNHKSQPYTNLFRDATGEPIAAPDRTNTTWESDPDSNFNKVKCLLPLHTGIFSNSKVFPALLTEGLRIEIILESAGRVLRIPDTINPARRGQLGLRFHSKDGKDASINAAAGNIAPNNTISSFFIARNNNITSVDNVPLVPGQRIAFCKCAGGSDAATESEWFEKPGDDWFAKWNHTAIVDKIELIPGTGATTNAGGRYGLIKITLKPIWNAGQTGITLEAGPTISNEEGWMIVDASVRNNVYNTQVALGDFKGDYKLSNVQMVIRQIDMPSGYTGKLMGMMKGGGTMNYDFLSNTNYKYSQLAGDRVANIRLPLSQSRAKSILSIPTDASVYTNSTMITGMKTALGLKFPGTTNDQVYPFADMPDLGTYVEDIDSEDTFNLSVRTGLVGLWDELTDYQWFYDGKLNPSRKVETAVISGRKGISQQPLIELEKALAMANIEPLSFRKFRSNCCIGRSLALQDGVYDCRGRDFNLQVNYQSLRTPLKNKLWNNFVAHLRRIEVKGDQISLQV
tara:strand:+ start:1359 stop:3338 length:1980 start_codon:yes stop_codon:yes gene_type:complete